MLYVAFAIAGACLTFVAARAEQTASDHATFRKLIDAYCAAWSTGNTENPARFYSKEDGLVFYDVAPFAYHGWKEYRDRAQKELFDNLASGTLTAGKDLKVNRHGTVAWTTVSMHFSEKTKDGKTLETDIRYTGSGKNALPDGFWCMNICRPRCKRISDLLGSGHGECLCKIDV